ncbi:hypothetical protein ACEWPM_005875 [Roseovarius sp. S4756]|uniref:hypothetical protein n=1 Tax=Roseovarius maritimus TaxID=3342637 RepID=UPI003728685D
MLTVITCVIPLLCSPDGACDARPELTADVRVRFADEVSIAEFWTNSLPNAEPWPAIIAKHGFPSNARVFFTSGVIHGSCMLFTVADREDPTVAHAQISVLPAIFSGEVSSYSGYGTCRIEVGSI